MYHVWIRQEWTFKIEILVLSHFNLTLRILLCIQTLIFYTPSLNHGSSTFYDILYYYHLILFSQTTRKKNLRLTSPVLGSHVGSSVHIQLASCEVVCALQRSWCAKWPAQSQYDYQLTWMLLGKSEDGGLKLERDGNCKIISPMHSPISWELKPPKRQRHCIRWTHLY